MSSTRTLLRKGLMLGAMLAMAGCMPPTYEKAAGLGVTPIAQYPLQTEMAPTGILLAPHAFGLSQAQGEALEDLVDSWMVHREGMVLIEAPSRGGPDAGATAYAARDALQRLGVPAASIQLVGYQDGGPPGAPIRVSHLTRQAKVNECGRSWSDLTKSGSNQPGTNFGCAVNANIAAMIDNPADIDAPRGQDPIDAGRRQVVIEKYRQGEVTSSQSDEKSDGAVSRAVN